MIFSAVCRDSPDQPSLTIRVKGQNVLVVARSLALSGETPVVLARSRRRWGLAVTCACVVRHCACVLAPPMGAITSGGLHVIGRIARDWEDCT